MRRPRVAVCVATYRRIEGLRRLLEGLDGLSFEKVEQPEVEIIVVDNDPTASVFTLCKDLKPRLGWPLTYCAEPRRGISQARNRAVACAVENADFIAFLDDDEVPERFWLDELLYIQRSCSADVVGGPVLPHFYETVPEWVIDGKFFEQPFERPRYPSGHLLTLTAAGNVLMRACMLREMDKLFDERLGLTGGEDTEFFTRVYRAGYRIVWADEAVVYEWTPGSRATARWLLKRAYRLGNSRSLYERYAGSSLTVQAMRLVKGVGRMVQGLALLFVFVPLSPLFGWRLPVRALQYICRGAGMLAGMVGLRYREYR